MGAANYRSSVTNEKAIDLVGGTQLVKQLQAVGVPTEAIKDANKKIGVIVTARGRIEVPKHTGRLMNSIRATALVDKVVVRAGTKSVPYANPIHWGWFYDKVNRHKRNIKPNPFLSRALGYTREEILHTYQKNMQDLIDRNYVPLRRGKTQVK